MSSVLCFDLWFTLIKPAREVARTYVDVLVEAEVRREAIFPFVRDHCMAKPLSYRQLVNDVCRHFHVVDLEIKAAVLQAWQNENRQVRWIGNAPVILESLCKRGVRLVLITNTTQVGWDEVDSILAISSYFDRIYLSWERGLVKPDPEVFREVMRWFPGLPPDEFLMVGDSIEHDIAVPRELGWQAIHIQNNSGIVSQLAAIEEVIHKCRGKMS